MSEEHRDWLLSYLLETCEKSVYINCVFIMGTGGILLSSVSFRLANDKDDAFIYNRPNGFYNHFVSVTFFNVHPSFINNL
tara:strand:- start:64 stop:303 length:240 start_codon:yes stop_codon:yes gene_type:complete